MIARVRIRLPFEVHVKASAKLSPLELTRDSDFIRLYPPQKSIIDSRDLEIDAERAPNLVALDLEKSADPQATEQTRIDGVATIAADLLQIDFVRSDFDRRQRLSGAEATEDIRATARAVDPALDDVIDIANDWLVRLRVVSRAGPLRPLDLTRCWLLVHYLNDDGTQLPQIPGLNRKIVWAPKYWVTLGLDERVWAAVDGLGWGYRPLPAQILILDAYALLPDSGPALMLANIALETRIGDVLDAVVPSTGVGPSLWRWLSNRAQFWQEPSVNDQFDELLKALSGHSLKDKPDLWQSFKQLREARNSFAHGGLAMVAKRPVVPEQASTLVDKAREILEWLDSLPYVEPVGFNKTFPMEFQYRTNLFSLPSLDADPGTSKSE